MVNMPSIRLHWGLVTFWTAETENTWKHIWWWQLLTLTDWKCIKMRIESTCHCSFVFLMKDMKRTLRFQAYQNIRNLMNPLAFALQKHLVHLTKILSSAKSRIQVLGYLVNCAGNRYPSTGSFLIKKSCPAPFLTFKVLKLHKAKATRTAVLWMEWGESCCSCFMWIGG